MDGLVFIMNQAGNALLELRRENELLKNRITELEEENNSVEKEPENHV